MSKTALAFACVLAAGVNAQLTEVSDTFYGCTDGSPSPALGITYKDVTVACGTQLSLELSQEVPTVTYARAADLNFDFYSLMLLNVDDLLPPQLQPISHNIVVNIPKSELLDGSVGSSPNSTKVPYYGSDPFLPGIVSPLEWRFHYVYVLFGQATGFVEFPLAQNWFVQLPVEELAQEYLLELVEQNYFVVSVNGCDDGEESCLPCPETNMVSDPANSPENCEDLCEDHSLRGCFFQGCMESCRRLC